MEEAEQDGAGGVGAEDAGAEGERGEAVATEKVDFVGNPAAFGTDGKESAIGRHKGGERGGSGGVGMRNPPGGVRRERGKNILDQRAEPAVDGHFGEEGVAGLAQAFEEAGADDGGVEGGGVEVAAFDLPGVCDEDVKSESEVVQSCPTLSDPMDCSSPGSSVHGIFQARVLEWGAIAFSQQHTTVTIFSIL